MIRFLAGLWLAVLVAAAPLHAQTFPKLSGRVVDDAHLLTPAQVQDITSKSEALEAASGRQFVVATIPSLEGHTIEDYGYRLGREWGIGQEKQDDGVILLVAPAEKKVRIETGYGARVFLTDAVSSVIIREDILPKFKAGDMGGGIVAGSDRIVSMMQLPAAEAAKRAQEVGAREQARQQQGGGFDIGNAIFIVILIFFFVLPMVRSVAGGRRYRHRGGINPWVVLWGLNALNRGSRGGGGWGGGGGFGGGGFGGGGGFSGGGGSFGGGGASGSW